MIACRPPRAPQNRFQDNQVVSVRIESACSGCKREGRMASSREPNREFVLVIEKTERGVSAVWEIRQADSLQTIESETAMLADLEAAQAWGASRPRAKGFLQILTLERPPPGNAPVERSGPSRVIPAKRS